MTATLTQDQIDNRDYDLVSGHYFTDPGGKFVPLSNRPATTTQEKSLKDVETVVDVAIIGFSTFVYVTSKDNLESIESILREATGESLYGITEDNTRRSSQFLVEFK